MTIAASGCAAASCVRGSGPRSTQARRAGTVRLVVQVLRREPQTRTLAGLGAAHHPHRHRVAFEQAPLAVPARQEAGPGAGQRHEGASQCRQHRFDAAQMQVAEPVGAPGRQIA